MDIKKALSYIATGFLLILLDFNLNVNALSANILPDFVGWILIYLSVDLLGGYTEGKKYLKWMALVLAILNAILWVGPWFIPAEKLTILVVLSGVISAFVFFILLGTLIQVGEDISSAHTGTLKILRWFMLFIHLFSAAGSLVVKRMGESPVLISPTMIAISVVLSLAMLVAAIVALVVLFKLKKEAESLPEAETPSEETRDPEETGH
ncbi:MAG: hypothetical protein IJ744_03890 [Lachnospiraceae bacterium]|nr:hypothetical protein [Lachnospiraceae bacterium]